MAGILRSLFGRSKREIWKLLADEIDAKFLERGWWEAEKVEVTYKEWTVTLDSFTIMVQQIPVTYTRFRAPFVNMDDFSFGVSPQGFFSAIGKFFGAQDIEVGFPEFDETFVIKSNNPIKVEEFFANKRIRTILSKDKMVSFYIDNDDGWFKKNYPVGVDSLSFSKQGIINEIPRLKELFDLFGESLDQLCHISSAYEIKPNVE